MNISHSLTQINNNNKKIDNNSQQQKRNIKTSKEIIIVEDLIGQQHNHQHKHVQNQEQQHHNNNSNECKQALKHSVTSSSNKNLSIVQYSKQQDEIMQSSQQLSSEISEAFSGQGDIKFSGKIMKNLQSSKNKSSQKDINYQNIEGFNIKEAKNKEIPQLKMDQTPSEYGVTDEQVQIQQQQQQQQQQYINKTNKQQQQQQTSIKQQVTIIDQHQTQAQPYQNQNETKQRQNQLNQQETRIVRVKSKLRFKQEDQNDHQSKSIIRNAMQLEDQRSSIPSSNSLKQNQSEFNVKKLFDQKFFAGRLSVVWIFIISEIPDELLQKLNKLYQNLVDKGYEKLVCHSIQQAQRFFKAQNSFFNVVSDLNNAEDLISNKNHLQSKILSIYLYNNDPFNGIMRSMNLKSRQKKIKGFYQDLTRLIKRAKLDIDNGNKFVQDQGNILEIKFRSKLPTFIKLNCQDVSQITEYRINLYGAIKLTDKQERQQKLEQFANLVKRAFHNKVQELQNLTDYLSNINHSVVQNLSEQELFAKHKKVLNFYVRETFYYKITNNLLRVCRTVEEFRPLTLPFNQNYNAIKYLHNLSIQQQKSNQQFTQLFRGASISKNEFQSLKCGDFIELLGCISTSKNQKYTIENFIRNNDDYLFIFTIRQRDLKEELKYFDHGYADLSQFDIVPKQFQAEEEVLLNALNVYKIREIVHSQSAHDKIGRVYLQYGAIFDLLQKPDEDLTEQEKNVLLNYRFCMRQMNEIQDQGDVLMKVQQFDKCKEFNEKKIKQLQQNQQKIKLNQDIQQQQKNKLLQEIQLKKIQYFNKLSHAYYSCGQTDQARLSAVESLKSYQRGIKKMAQIDRLKCMKIFQVHEKTLNILVETEDTVNITKMINIQMDIFQHKNDWLGKAQKLMQKGEIQLKQGKIIESQTHLKESQKILIEKKNSFENRRKEIENNFFFKQLFNCFCFKNNNLQDQKLRELRKVDEDYNQYLNVENKLKEFLLKVNECMRNVAEFVGDKKTYEKCVKKGKQYFQQLDLKQTTNKFQIAQLKVIEAKVENAFQKTQNVQKSYQLMDEAINLIEKVNPSHEKVAEYSTLMGLFKKKQCFNKLRKIDQIQTKDKSKVKTNIEEYQNAQQNKIDLNPSQNLIINEQQKEIKAKNDSILGKSRQFMEKQKEQYVEKRRLTKQQQEREVERQKSFGLFNEPHHKPKYVEIISYFNKALNIIIGHKTQDNPHVLEVRNYLGQVQYEFCNFKDGKQQAHNVLKTKTGLKHTQGAKSALLLAKISLSQGELKQAFQNIQKSHFILRLALVKQHQNPKYQQLYKLSPIFLQIELYKCKIYNRQKDHDLALKTITNLRDLGMKKLRDADGVGYLADIYQEMGNTLVNKGNRFEFEDCYEKAIKLRQKQMGKYNILNAICQCSLAKYLVFTNDGDTAQKRLADSLQIFAHFAHNHPNFWVQYSTMAFLSQHNKEREKEMALLRNSVKLIEKRYSKNHINLLKIKVRFAQVLLKNNSDEEALKIFEHLQKQMDSDISLSQKGDSLKQTENEKVAVKDFVEKSIEQTRLRITESKSRIKIDINFSPRTQLSPKINYQPKVFEKSNAKLIDDNIVSKEEISQFH